MYERKLRQKELARLLGIDGNVLLGLAQPIVAALYFVSILVLKDNAL